MKIVALLTISVLLGSVASASTPLENHHVKDSTPSGVHYDSGRVEGDTIEESWVIEDLPFTGFDNTCGFNDDYDEVCPYTGSTSGDVVYAYSPGGDETITIDLCWSLYDTKVYVYEDYHTPGAPFACNDDAHFDPPCYTYSSRIHLLDIFAGHTYYIVVDGYGGDCGDYQLEVTPEEPCILECPDGALVEGEPPCVDEYEDYYNSGCGVLGTEWTLIEAYEDDCAIMCGLSCTYHYQWSSYRDTDWFTMTAVGGDVTATCEAPTAARPRAMSYTRIHPNLTMSSPSISAIPNTTRRSMSTRTTGRRVIPSPVTTTRTSARPAMSTVRGSSSWS